MRGPAQRARASGSACRRYPEHLTATPRFLSDFSATCAAAGIGLFVTPQRKHCTSRGMYEAWVREHHAAVWRTARRIVRDDAFASDIVQRVYARAFERGLGPGIEFPVEHGVDPASDSASGSTSEPGRGRDPERWLCWLACKEALTELRARRRRAEHEERAAMRDENDPRPGPAEQASAADARAWLAQELAALSDELRSALVLRFQQGLSLREIGALLELGESGVHERIERGLAALRRRAQRAGMAGVLVDFGSELSACEAFAAPPAALASSLLAVAPASSVAAGSLLIGGLGLALLALGAALWSARSSGDAPELVRANSTPVDEPRGVVLASAIERADPRSSGPSLRQPVPAVAAVRPPPPQAPPPPAAAGEIATLRHGRLVDRVGAPLPGFHVRCTPNTKAAAARSAITALDGSFAFEFPVGSRCTLEAEAVVGALNQELTFDPRADAIALLKSAGLALAAELDRDWQLDMHVTDARGRSVDGLDLMLRQSGLDGRGWCREWRGQTDSAGRLRFADHGPGEHVYELRDPLRRYAPLDGRIVLAAGANECALRLPETVALRGRLVCPAGEALDGIPLRLDLGPGWETYIELDAHSGAFEVRVLPGQPFVLRRDGGRHSGFQHRVAPPFPARIELVLKRADDTNGVGVHGGELHGRFLDAAGSRFEIEPFSVLAVRMDEAWTGLEREWNGEFWSEAAGWLRPFRGQVAHGPEGPPPATSEFHLTGLEPGRYAIVASAGRRPLGLAGPFVLGADATGQGEVLTGVDVRFEIGWSIELELDGVPAELARARVGLVGGADFPPDGVGFQRPDAKLSFSDLHPRATYRVVLADGNGAHRSSERLTRPPDGGQLRLRMEWPR
jgi:RNA polymerase sigma factor (sigma-70 family)